MSALQSPWMKRLAINKDPQLQASSELDIIGGNKSDPWGCVPDSGGNKSVAGSSQLDVGGNPLDLAGRKSYAGGIKSVKESLSSRILPKMSAGFRPWIHLRLAANPEEARISNPGAGFPSASPTPPDLVPRASSPAAANAIANAKANTNANGNANANVDALARWKKPPRPPPTNLEHSSKEEWLSLSTSVAASAFPAVKNPPPPIAAIGEERKEMQLSWPLLLSMKGSYKQGLEASRASEAIESRMVGKANDVMPITHKGTANNSEIEENQQRDEAIRGASSVSTGHVFRQEGWEIGSTPSSKRSREIEGDCEPLGSKVVRQPINPHIWVQRWCRFARAEKLLTRNSLSSSSLPSKAKSIESGFDHEPHSANSLPSAAAMALVSTASRCLHSIQPHQQRRRRGEEGQLLHGTGSLSMSSHNKCL